MKALELVRKTLLYASAVACCLAGVGSARALLAAQVPPQDEEQQMGQEIFNELKAKGEIVESSPLYDVLKPIAGLGAMLEEAKSQIRVIEAHHKGKEAQAKIDALKAKAHEVEKKHHTLKAIGEVGAAAVIKAEIESNLAKLKGELEQFDTKVGSQSATK